MSETLKFNVCRLAKQSKCKINGLIFCNDDEVMDLNWCLHLHSSDPGFHLGNSNLHSLGYIYVSPIFGHFFIKKNLI